MHYNVLVVDDEVELAEYTCRYFNMSGVTSQYVINAKACMEFFEENSCSLILLDINLGDDSGFELCQRLRKEIDVPILFISARSSEDDMMLALNIGGDDYICKPYSLSVLCAKVKAILKRYEKAAQSAKENESLIRLGDAKIDLKAGTIIKAEEVVRLKAMEFKLLTYLLSNTGRIIPKEEFFDNVWETEYVGNVTLNVHIRHLREKLEKDPQNPEYIKTVWGVGYIMEIK